MEIRNSYGKAGKRAEGPEGDKNSTGRPTISINMDTSGSQRLKSQSKNIYSLKLGLTAHM